MLHSLHTGTVQSKRAGMKWAEQTAELRWLGIIHQAWEEREGVRFCEKIRQSAERQVLDDSLAFLQYMVKQSENVPVPGLED